MEADRGAGTDSGGIDVVGAAATAAEAIDRLASYEAIRQLVAHYAHHLDRRDISSLAELYVPDVRVTRTESGRDSLAAQFDRMLREVQVTILDTGTHAIDFVDADHATGNVYCHGEIQIGDRWIHQAIRYDDRYERRGRRWYFAARRHQLWYGADVGQNPLTYAPAEWPRSNIGSGTLPHDQETWQRFWSG